MYIVLSVIIIRPTIIIRASSENHVGARLLLIVVIRNVSLN